jgi:CH-like domain in sperm protein
MATTVGMAA